jgi:hypothetical protein
LVMEHNLMELNIEHWTLDMEYDIRNRF